MKKVFFNSLAQLNKILLPSFKDKDLTKLSTLEKALIAYRYWVTIHVLDLNNKTKP